MDNPSNALASTQDALTAVQEDVDAAISDRNAGIASARATGMSASEIARIIGTDSQIVYRVLRRAGSAQQ